MSEGWEKARAIGTKNEWIRRSRSGSRGPFYLAKASSEWRSLGGDPSAGSPTDTLFTCSPCRHGAWTVSSSDAPCVGARRAVSEGSDLAIGLPCGLSAPRDCYRDSVLEDPRSSPHIARFVPVPYGSGVATQFTT